MADLKQTRLMSEAVREAKRDRVLKAAVTFVYDKKCRVALRDLEQAVEDLIGTPLAKAPPVVRMRR